MSTGMFLRTAEDYRHAQSTFNGPSPVARLDNGYPGFAAPYFLAPFDFLGIPNSKLVFGVTPASPYWKYWERYPRRRLINPIVSSAELNSEVP